MEFQAKTEGKDKPWGEVEMQESPQVEQKEAMQVELVEQKEAMQEASQEASQEPLQLQKMSQA